MGITKNCVKFLLYSISKKDVRFEKTIMLGRQFLYATDKEITALCKKYSVVPQSSLESDIKSKYAEPLFHLLGAKTIDSMDFSNYEEATVIHDLNIPIRENLKGQYSVVFDGGTLEHVFNFPVAVKNCMDMLRVGGHFISITPTNNFCGHGFYQFSPELFYALFHEKNGFKTKSVFLAVEKPDAGIKEWYEVSNPSEVKQRVTLSNDHPSYLLVLAEKTHEINTALFVQQSDYENVWNVFHSIQADERINDSNALIYYYRKYTPRFIKNALHYSMNSLRKKERPIDNLGTVNSAFFKKVDF